MKQKLKKKNNGYYITAYCSRRDISYSWTTGKRGLERTKELIRFEGLTKIKVKQI